MSISSVLLSGLSGLRAAQTGINTVSQNIANANTPGYVRTEVTLSPLTQIGDASGVRVEGVRRAADRFLATASYIATASQGAATARADLLTRAQSTFGDPSKSSSMFGMLDEFWSAMTEIGVDPSSALRRGDAVSSLQTLFAETQRVGQSIQDLIGEADQRISDAVQEAQSLMDRIAQMNQEIRLTRSTGADSSGAENAQSALVDRLSALMDVRVTQQPDGGIHVRTSGGALLVGVEAAKLSYTPNNASFTTQGVITINEQLGTQANLEPLLLGGEIKGLLQARDVDLPGLAEALGGFTATLADSLNAVHNENSSSPAVSSLVGRQTGLLGSDAIGFSGQAIIGITDAGGALSQRLTIDFDAMTITGEQPAATYSFAGGTITDFAAALDAAMGAASPPGNASFTNGVLSLDVGSNGGIVVQQDPNDPADRAGRGFSHFFGLNDLVSRPNPLFFESGIQGTDEHGLNQFGTISYQVRDSAGRFVANRTVEITGPLFAPGSTWNDVLTALNAPGTGLGEYGSFSLNSSTGQIGFTPIGSYTVSLLQDTTTRGSTGVSFTALNGLSESSTAGRAIELDVDSAIASNPSLLAVARPDLTSALGSRIIEAGDNRGATALVNARDTVRSFSASGILTPQATSLANYASRFGGEVARLATDAQRAQTGAAAVATAAADRRSEVEGVSVDDELMRMTVYQNAYAASARVIQAATDMLDVLMNLGYR